MSTRFPQQVNIPTAVTHRSKFDLSGDNITTSDIFKVKPSKILECIPGDSIDLSTESLIRMYPLTRPLYGRMNHFSRWFWVPMRTIMKGWNNFIEQTPFQSESTGSIILNSVPYFTNADIVQFFAQSLVPDTPVYGNWCFLVSSVNPDAVIYVDDGGYQYDVYTYLLSLSALPSGVIQTDNGYFRISIKFTKQGRAFLDLLQNLGYNINWSCLDNRQLSALPLLAYLRVFSDFYVSPQYIDGLQDFFNLTTGNMFSQIDYLSERLYELVPGFSNFDPDYFVSAWDHPSAPNDLLGGMNIRIPDITLPNVAPDDRSEVFVSNGSNVGTPVLRSGSAQNTPSQITQYILNQLRATTNYALRHNIAGYKFWDRLKAEYNVTMDYKEKGTSLYLDSIVTPIKISEVVSQSDTEGAALGDYAGKGLGYTEGKSIHFESENEFGYLICISSIVPATGYYQGTIKENTHLTPLSFFHGDYDQQGVQAIRLSELYSSAFVAQQLEDLTNEENISQDFDPDRIFGYIPQYAEYKRGTDTLTGDFRVNSRSSDGAINSWHLLRIVANEFDRDLDQDSSLLVHSLNFIQGDNAQFDRIFANTSDEYDHFIIVHHHEIHATRNMKSLADSLFDDEQLQHSQKTEVANNGQMFN